MSSNEDYLDSLLKMAQEDVAPDSAISKVSELTKLAQEEALAEAAETEENVEAAGSVGLDLDAAALETEDNEEVLSDVDLENLLASVENTEDVEEATVDNSDLEALLANVEAAEGTEEAVVEEPVSDEIVVDETPIEESVSDESNGDVDLEALLSDVEAIAEAEEKEADLLEEAALIEETPEEVAEEIPEEIFEEVLEEISEDADSEESTEDVDLETLLAGVSQSSESEETPLDGESTPSASDDMSMLSQEDIERLLNEASDVSDVTPEQPQGEIEVDMDDLASLESLGIFDKDARMEDVAGDQKAEGETSEELQEIESLLQTADNPEFSLNEDDELMNMLALESKRQAEEEEIRNRKNLENEANETVEEKPVKEKKKLFGKKKKTEEAPAEGEEDSPKEMGVFAKFISFLTVSDEDEEEKPEGEDFGFEDVQGENKEILEELDKEKGGKKKKKGKKKKGKEEGEGSEEGSGESKGGDEEEESADSGKKKKKKVKVKKEKKEKKPKLPEPDNSKPLNKKNVKKIGIMAFMILVLILLIVLYIPKLITQKAARAAYYKGDYETTYLTFFGEKLSESDQLLFDRSEIILTVNHKYDAFVTYNKIGMKTEALDQLLQAVDNYEDWRYKAESCGAVEGFSEAYGKIVTALEVNYGLDTDRAKEIIALPTDLEYSLMVESIANGTAYIDPNEPLPEPFVPIEEEEEPEYEDMLDEEKQS